MSIYPSRQPPPRHPTPWVGVVLLLAVLALVTWRFWPAAHHDAAAVPRPVAERGPLDAEELATIDLYDRISPSVVHVTNLAERQGGFSLDVQQVPRGSGTGFMWDNEGHVVTNYHVVEGADAVTVTLADHSSYPAKKIVPYPDKDLAVIWIDAPARVLRPIPLGTSHDLKVGQKTFVIGNPFGLDQTLTTGVVSALGREITSVTKRPIQGVIQTSAAINPGNSGGPLLDSAGRLIGVTTAILSPSGAFAGVGFAIPVDEVNTVVPDLIRHGKVVKPRLGVQLAEDQTARRLGVDRGALILLVVPGSPAAQAGLRGSRRDRDSGHIYLGDVITAVDGKPVRGRDDLLKLLDTYKVGDQVKVTFVRGDEEQTVAVTLQPPPEQS